MFIKKKSWRVYVIFLFSKFLTWAKLNTLACRFLVHGPYVSHPCFRQKLTIGLNVVFLMPLAVFSFTRGILELKLQNIMCDRKHLFERQSVQLREKNRYSGEFHKPHHTCKWACWHCMWMHRLYTQKYTVNTHCSEGGWKKKESPGFWSPAAVALLSLCDSIFTL